LIYRKGEGQEIAAQENKSKREKREKVERKR